MNFNKLIAECSDYDFKEQLEIKKPKSWLKTVSAFANGIGGTLFFGIDNNKQLININNPQLVCDKISELINSKIDPVPIYIIEPHKERAKGNEYVYITLKIEPGPRTPYYYSSDGIKEVYIRSGNQSIKSPRYILEELILKGQNKTFDSIVTNYLKSNYSFTFF
ncbi:MAG: ATP-binding protein [Bacilli bacterium]|nr:ATP-binding protein [Bacilli bacterium]